MLTLERRDPRTITQWQCMKKQGYLGNSELTKLIGYNFHPQDGQMYELRNKFLEEQNEN